jgi:mRNA interferase RelE/StbE
MTWELSYSKRALRQLKALDRGQQRLVMAWLEKHLSHTDDPRSIGHALTGGLKGLWRYRIGDYRIIANIQDDKLVILFLEFGHRSDAYSKHLPVN